MFESIEDVIERLRAQNYICDRRIATVVFLAEKMQKPVLVEGPAGVGKTDLAKVTATALERPLLRLQCYEGLDEGKALYEWEYAKQLLYTQILRDKIGEVLEGTESLGEAIERLGAEDSAFYSERFLVPRPLLAAIRSETPSVLLIDEVDKADQEFEAFLLEVLSDFQVSVPELGTVSARHRPIVFLTSNNAREMSDALKRRCLHLFIDFPEERLENEIVRRKVPELEKQLGGDLVHLIHSLRRQELKKSPSISETLDWARSLVILTAKELGEETVRETLNIVLKYEEDMKKGGEALDKLLAGRAKPGGGGANPSGGGDGGGYIN